MPPESEPRRAQHASQGRRDRDQVRRHVPHVLEVGRPFGTKLPVLEQLDGDEEEEARDPGRTDPCKPPPPPPDSLLIAHSVILVEITGLVGSLIFIRDII